MRPAPSRDALRRTNKAEGLAAVIIVMCVYFSSQKKKKKGDQKEKKNKKEKKTATAVAVSWRRVFVGVCVCFCKCFGKSFSSFFFFSYLFAARRVSVCVWPHKLGGVLSPPARLDLVDFLAFLRVDGWNKVVQAVGALHPLFFPPLSFFRLRTNNHTDTELSDETHFPVRKIRVSKYIEKRPKAKSRGRRCKNIFFDFLSSSFGFVVLLVFVTIFPHLLM